MYDGYRTLAVMVIIQAIRDYCWSGKEPPANKQYRVERYRNNMNAKQEAQDWFFNWDNEDAFSFEWYCRWLDYDPASFRDRILDDPKKLLKELSHSMVNRKE